MDQEFENDPINCIHLFPSEKNKKIFIQARDNCIRLLELTPNVSGDT